MKANNFGSEGVCNVSTMLTFKRIQEPPTGQFIGHGEDVSGQSFTPPLPVLLEHPIQLAPRRSKLTCSEQILCASGL